MKRFLLTLTFAGGIFVSGAPARADIWGGDVAVLIEILANAVRQLAELRGLLNSASSQLDLIRQINRGINDSLQLIRTAYPNIDPGIYKEWDKVNRALQGVATVYGAVPSSADTRVQTDADQSVAEAISLNNQVYDYTRKIDDIGDRIKDFSHSVSPGGAAKLSAEGIGVLLTVMNQSLRTQATGLKLQAQSLAIENRREKESTRFLLGTSDALGSAMQSLKPTFQVPRF